MFPFEPDCRDERDSQGELDTAVSCTVKKPFAGLSYSETVCVCLLCQIPPLGAIDMDLITTGVSASERSRRGLLTTALRNWILDNLQEGAGPVRVNQVSGKILRGLESLQQHPLFGSHLRLLSLFNGVPSLDSCRGFASLGSASRRERVAGTSQGVQ